MVNVWNESAVFLYDANMVNELAQVTLSIRFLIVWFVPLQANPSLGRNDLIDVHLSNEDFKDVHPAVEVHSH